MANLSFLDDAVLWAECKEKADKGLSVSLSLDEKRRLYAVMAKLSKVYFIDAPGCGVLRIGKTPDIDKRMATLQTHSPVKLGLLVTIEYDHGLVDRIHGHLADYRSHGEWFYACAPVRGIVCGYLGGGLPWLVDTVGDAPQV
jgi:hypothetical protein